MNLNSGDKEKRDCIIDVMVACDMSVCQASQIINFIPQKTIINIKGYIRECTMGYLVCATGYYDHGHQG